MDSLEYLDECIAEINEYAPLYVSICVYGNKNDYNEEFTTSITLEQGRNKCNKFQQKYPHLDIRFVGHGSCKTGENINYFINYGLQMCLNKSIACDKCGSLVLKKEKIKWRRFSQPTVINKLQFGKYL